MEKEKLLINPREEAARSHKYDDIGSLYIAAEIAEAFRSFYAEEYPDTPTNTRWFNYCLLASLFWAGRVQGIREERARNKARARAETENG